MRAKPGHATKLHGPLVGEGASAEGSGALWHIECDACGCIFVARADGPGRRVSCGHCSETIVLGHVSIGTSPGATWGRERYATHRRRRRLRGHREAFVTAGLLTVVAAVVAFALLIPGSSSGAKARSSIGDATFDAVREIEGISDQGCGCDCSGDHEHD